MGFFSNIFKQGKELSKIAKAVSSIKIQLDKYEQGGEIEIEYCIFAAWVCKKGFLDIIEKNNYPLVYSLYVPIDGRNRKMTLNEAYLLTVGRLNSKVSDGTEELKSIVEDILEGGSSLNKYEVIIPSDLKKHFI